MKRNNKALYEKIMRNISNNIKHVLYEDIQNFSTSDYQDQDNEIIDSHDIENMIIDKSLRVKALSSILDRSEKTSEQIFDFIKKHENDNIEEFFTEKSDLLQRYGVFILFMIAAAFEYDHVVINDDNIRIFANTRKIGYFDPFVYCWFEEDADVDNLIDLLKTNKKFKNLIKNIKRKCMII